MRFTRLPLRQLLTLVCLAGAVSAFTQACNPANQAGTRVDDGVGIRDYFTMRSVDGRLTTRDVRPEPRPREAITGDDYFRLKLEHMYIGEELGRAVGNVVVINQLDGVLPKQVTCNELDVRGEFGMDLENRERANVSLPQKCAYKHVVAINPVFQNGHVTFDSAYISPPFRMGREPVELRFMISQLNDVELARQLLKWGEEQLNNLNEWGLEELDLTQWQSKLVDIGFTVANYILDYAAKPSYIFDFQTAFVPIETVGGVTSPQNLFMGGDFIIAGFPPGGGDKGGALLASDTLVFDSGRLYYKDTRKEYREAAYIVFKVERQSRYPGDLPVQLAQISRSLERGRSADEVATMARNIVLDLQDARVVNETEGAYLKDMVGWFAEARTAQSQLKQALDGKRVDPDAVPPQLREAGSALAPDLALVGDVARSRRLMEDLARIYDNYSRSPGMMQAECIVIRDVTQGIAESYGRLRPTLLRAFEDLQLQRSNLDRKTGRSPAEEQRLAALLETEAWLARQLDGLPEKLSAPQCPALRD